MWKFELKDSHKRYLICICLVFSMFLPFRCFFVNTICVCLISLFVKPHLRRQFPHTPAAQFGHVDADVAIYHEDVSLFGANHILVMEVAEVYFRGGVCPSWG